MNWFMLIQVVTLAIVHKDLTGHIASMTSMNACHSHVGMEQSVRITSTRTRVRVFLDSAASTAGIMITIVQTGIVTSRHLDSTSRHQNQIFVC
jgi:hypothetical protein